jgi:probable F420-dependent oxidoreductase
VGLGAGWRISDYEVSGIPFDPPGVRIDRLGESIHLLKALWSGEPVHHEGRHFRVEGMAGFPLPVQRPHPPLIVGGGGRRVLSLAAREADIVGIIPSLTAGKVDASTGREATPEATDQKLAWIREAAGDRFGDIELQVRLEVALVTDDPDPYFEALSGSFGLTPDQARGCPYALCGPVEAMVDQLVERRERWGLSYVGIPFEAVEAMAPVVAKLAGT